MSTKDPLFQIVITLLLTLGAITAYSYWPEPVTVSFEMKQPGIRQFLEGKKKPLPRVAPRKDLANVLPGDTVVEKALKAEAGEYGAEDNPFAQAMRSRNTMDTTPQRILMIGESMIEGIFLRWKHDYEKANGHLIRAQIWYGSTTREWARNDTLKQVIRWFKPTLVFVSIGGNELSVRDLDKRQENIENILGQLEGTPYIWIGPPNWKKDSGIGEILESHVPEDQYFLSRNLTYKRRRDGAHPTEESCRMWADTLAQWVMLKSAYPIKLYPPAPKAAAVKSGGAQVK